MTAASAGYFYLDPRQNCSVSVVYRGWDRGMVPPHPDERLEPALDCGLEWTEWCSGWWGLGRGAADPPSMAADLFWELWWRRTARGGFWTELMIVKPSVTHHTHSWDCFLKLRGCIHLMLSPLSQWTRARLDFLISTSWCGLSLPGFVSPWS